MSQTATNTAEKESESSDERSLLEQTLNSRLIVDVADLGNRLNLPETIIKKALEVTKEFPLLFPESTLTRVKLGDPNDPVLKQFFPDIRELEKVEGFCNDPLCEHQLTNLNNAQTSCVLQKYAGRALVITTNTCAGRCRFCFRRYFPKNRSLFPIPQSEKKTANCSTINQYLNQALASIRDNPTISEVILSGGDPLTLPNDSLTALVNYITRLDHVKRVRFHTRAPVLTPLRIGADFPEYDTFQQTRENNPLILHMVLHINVAEEIDNSVAQSIQRLRKKGYILTSQTVLLHGVNDNIDSLTKLYEKLINLGVIPYYLFQLDRIQGAAHFETPVEFGRTLIEQLGERVPGYAIPHYSREIPGRPMKTNLFIDRSQN